MQEISANYGFQKLVDIHATFPHLNAWKTCAELVVALVDIQNFAVLVKDASSAQNLTRYDLVVLVKKLTYGVVLVEKSADDAFAKGCHYKCSQL
jgi:hypothetical protein